VSAMATAMLARTSAYVSQGRIVTPRMRAAIESASSAWSARSRRSSSSSRSRICRSSASRSLPRRSPSPRSSHTQPHSAHASISTSSPSAPSRYTCICGASRSCAGQRSSVSPTRRAAARAIHRAGSIPLAAARRCSKKHPPQRRQRSISTSAPRTTSRGCVHRGQTRIAIYVAHPAAPAKGDSTRQRRSALDR
jgi:hypothetical protein